MAEEGELSSPDELETGKLVGFSVKSEGIGKEREVDFDHFNL